MLAMALQAARSMLPPAALEVEQLRPALLLDDLGLNGRAIDQRIADRGLVTTKHQDFVELDGLADLCVKLLDREELILGDLVLLAARLHDSEHCLSFLSAPCGGR